MEATVREAIIQPTQDANMIGSGLAHSLLRVDTDIDKVMRQREPERSRSPWPQTQPKRKSIPAWAAETSLIVHYPNAVYSLHNEEERFLLPRTPLGMTAFFASCLAGHRCGHWNHHGELDAAAHGVDALGADANPVAELPGHGIDLAAH